MAEQKDYYQILGIDPTITQEGVKRAYLELAKMLHPDHLGDRSESARHWAEERLKEVNEAYEILGNPQKRRGYDAEWHQRGAKPKPTVDPQNIRFDNVKPWETQTSSFIIRNAGGPFAKIWVSSPDSWLKVTSYSSLTDSEELPLRVEIEAEGTDWNKTYSEVIIVKLDEEEIQVKVELQTKPVPIRAKATARTRRRTGYTPPPPPPATHKHGLPAWGKWAIGLIFLGVVIGQFWPSNSSPTTINPTPSTQSATSTMRAGPTLLKGHFYLDAPGISNPRLKANLEKWLMETYPDLAKARDMFGDPDFTIKDYASVGKNNWVVYSWKAGYGYIFYSPNDGETWQLQLRDPYKKSEFSGNYPFIIYFSNEIEGWVGTKSGLLYTNDGGNNWEFRDVTGEGFYVNQYWFYSNQHIVVSFAYGGTYESFDGGKTWISVNKQ